MDLHRRCSDDGCDRPTLAQVLARAGQRGDVIELTSCFTRSEDKRPPWVDQAGTRVTGPAC